MAENEPQFQSCRRIFQETFSGSRMRANGEDSACSVKENEFCDSLMRIEKQGIHIIMSLTEYEKEWHFIVNTRRDHT